jgi:ABC-type transport system substrate-binding protein
MCRADGAGTNCFRPAACRYNRVETGMRHHSSPLSAVLVLLAGSMLVLPAPADPLPWNRPYPAADAQANIIYDSFEERPKHLDPAQSYAENEAIFLAQIYEPPLQYHYLRRPYTLVPLTVERVPVTTYLDAAGAELPVDAPAERVAVSVYRFELRRGVRFQPHPAFARNTDGSYRYFPLGAEQLAGVHALSDFAATGTRELLAADYVYAIKRLAHPAVQSPILGVMAERIVGLDEYAEGLRRVWDAQRATDGFLDLRRHDLPGARVIDDYTWEVRVSGRYPQFLFWQAMTFFAPMPWEVDRFHSQPGMAERNVTLDWYPVGTGPFMLTENNPNRRMVLERNPNFRGEPYPTDGTPEDRAAGLLDDSGRQMPFVDRAVYTLETESIPRWTKFLQGYYDTSGISSDNFDQVIRYQGAQGTLSPEMTARGIRLLTEVAPTTYYTGFNMLDPVVGGLGEAQRKLRLAIAIAVDYEEFISIFRNDRGIAAQGPIPPGIPGVRTGQSGINPYVYEWGDGRAVRKSLAEARQLLAEAGYPGGVDPRTGRPLVLYLDTPATGPDAKSTLEWWRKQFAKLDIQLVVRDTDYNRFQEKMRKGNAQIFQWGWSADYPDAENFLFLLAGGNAKVQHGGENAANYGNPGFDARFATLRSMDDGPERWRVLDEMLEIVRHDSPWLWGFHPTGYSLVHAWQQNTKPNMMARNTLKYVRIDPALRDRRQRVWNTPQWRPPVVILVLVVGFLIPALLLYRRRQQATAR